MQRTWMWVAVAIAGGWWLFMLPGVLFLLMFPEPATSVGLGLAGLAWIGIALMPAAHPRVAGAWFVVCHATLLLAMWLMFEQAIHWLMLPQAMAVVAALAAAVNLPVQAPGPSS